MLFIYTCLARNSVRSQYVVFVEMCTKMQILKNLEERYDVETETNIYLQLTSYFTGKQISIC